jgi:hypothetical protein
VSASGVDISYLALAVHGLHTTAVLPACLGQLHEHAKCSALARELQSLLLSILNWCDNLEVLSELVRHSESLQLLARACSSLFEPAVLTGAFNGTLVLSPSTCAYQSAEVPRALTQANHGFAVALKG